MKKSHEQDILPFMALILTQVNGFLMQSFIKQAIAFKVFCNEFDEITVPLCSSPLTARDLQCRTWYPVRSSPKHHVHDLQSLPAVLHTLCGGYGGLYSLFLPQGYSGYLPALQGWIPPDHGLYVAPPVIPGFAQRYRLISSTLVKFWTDMMCPFSCRNCAMVCTRTGHGGPTRNVRTDTDRGPSVRTISISRPESRAV